MPSVCQVNLPREYEGPAEWRDRYEYVNGDQMTFVLRDPCEFRMGADSWQIDLLDSNRSVIRNHPQLTSSAGVRRMHPYQPWDSTRQNIAICDWSRRIATYSVETGSFTEWNDFGFPISIVGSFSIPRFAVVSRDDSFLTDTKGAVVAVLGSMVPSERERTIFWIPDTPILFAIESASSALAFFDGENGEVINRVSIDPDTYLPYDRAAYTSVSREHFTLRERSGTRCVGWLLDTWTQIEFLGSEKLLLLSVYRPTTGVSIIDGQHTCNVELRRVALQISP